MAIISTKYFSKTTWNNINMILSIAQKSLPFFKLFYWHVSLSREWLIFVSVLHFLSELEKHFFSKAKKELPLPLREVLCAILFYAARGGKGKRALLQTLSKEIHLVRKTIFLGIFNDCILLKVRFFLDNLILSIFLIVYYSKGKNTALKIHLMI